MGVAHNKFLAKVAPDLKKPRGFVVVDPDKVEVFMATAGQPAVGGGPENPGNPRGLGIKTIGDLQATSL